MSEGEEKVIAEVREIIQSIENDDETPGGVEHLGDFRRLILRWQKMLVEGASTGVKP